MRAWQRESARRLVSYAGVVPALFTPGEPLRVFLAAWDLYALVHLGLTWLAVRRGGIVFLRAMSAQSRRPGRAERWFMSSPEQFSRAAAGVALIAVILVMPQAESQGTAVRYVLAACLVAVVASWLMLQTGFLTTYVGTHGDHGGLRFPDEKDAGLVDFASFTVAVGTTFGTTDVSVTHTAMRRQVPSHGVLASCSTPWCSLSPSRSRRATSARRGRIGVMRFEDSARIDAPTQVVWETYTDVVSWPEWTESVTSVELLDPGPLRVGSRARIRQPRLPVAVWTVTEVVEGRSFTWVAKGPGLRSTATHRVDPDGAGALATARVDQEGPLGGLLGRLTAGLTRRYLALETAGLKARAEGR